jgi:putative transposase
VPELGRSFPTRRFAARALYRGGMARLLRSLLPDGIYHVSTRGVYRAWIFRDDEDRLMFMRLLVSTAKRHNWRVHCFCLMGTHYHLVIECTREDLSAGLHWLNGVYAQKFNERHGRHGHLFGDRFACKLIESEEQLAATIAYVLYNPVTAGLCAQASDWLWSGVSTGHDRQGARSRAR